MEIQFKETDRIFLFGAGTTCESYLSTNLPYFNKIEGVLDNDKKRVGGSFKTLNIFSLDYLEQFNNDDILVIITSDYYYEKMKKQILDIGIRKVIPYWNSPLYIEFLTEKIECVKKIVEDDKSKDILDSILNYRKNDILNWHKINDEVPYFPMGIFNLNDSEIFVDAGSYTGDTIDTFVEKTGKWKKIYCIEPDVKNLQKLKGNHNKTDNLEIVYAALGKENTTTNFYSGLGCGSRINYENITYHFDDPRDIMSERSITTVNLITLDSLNIDATFIKMDIEGAEVNALKGSSETILRCKPKLAICLYHDPTDLWEIPLFLKKLVPEYKIYIRHHSDTYCDTILYAKV